MKSKTPQPTLTELQMERSTLFSSHSNVVTPNMEIRRSVLINNMKQQSKSGNRTLCLLDLNMGRFIHHISAYKSQQQPSIVTEQPDNWQHANQLCHPNELLLNTETDILFYRQLMALPPEQRIHFVMLCLRRLRNKNNGHNIYLLRVNVVELDDMGHPWLVMVEAELMTQLKPKIFYPNRQYFITNEQDNSIRTQFSEHCISHLTNQEYEVLELACNGFSIEEMAKKLFISISTVKTHRSQIIEKLNAASLPYACTMAVNLRMIDGRRVGSL